MERPSPPPPHALSNTDAVTTDVISTFDRIFALILMLISKKLLL